MPDEAVVDIIGVGFGPSNLALAVALAERPEQAPRALFVEQKPAFSWHPGMLLDGSRAQVPSSIPAPRGISIRRSPNFSIALVGRAPPIGSMLPSWHEVTA